MSNATDEILFALCHELGNLVGAIRLNAHLIDGTASVRELANVSLEIDDTSARLGSLLALVRPIVSGGDAPGLDAGELLVGIGDALEEYGGRGVEIAVRPGPELSRVPGRQDALHHLLLSFAYYAVEEAQPRGRVDVFAESGDGRVTIRIEDNGPEELGLGEPGDGPPTGRNLMCAIGSVVLGRWGGTVEASRDAAKTRIALRLPTR